MIPKIVHYCWFGDREIPSELLHYIDSWKLFLPEYKFILWNEKNTTHVKSMFFRAAIKNKMYAFASDYIRLYALYEYGGIYLDCDVEVFKSFNDLLHLPYFIGKENTKYIVDSAVIGSEKGISWIKLCRDSFDEVRINKKSPFKEVLPSFLSRILIEKGYKFRVISNTQYFSDEKYLINLFPNSFFCPKNYYTGKITTSKDTYCIHHFAGSWQSKKKKLLLKLWLPFSLKFPNISHKLSKMVGLGN